MKAKESNRAMMAEESKDKKKKKKKKKKKNQLWIGGTQFLPSTPKT